MDILVELMEFKGEVFWDKTKVTGQKNNQLDVELAKKEIKFVASTSLVDGLKNTIDWFMYNKVEY